MEENTRKATRHWTLAQPVVSAYVTSIVRDIAARDDVLQDIAVAVIESFDSYDAERPFVGWALGIAQNQVALYLRRVRRDRLVFDEHTIANLATAFASISDQISKLDYLRDCLQRLEGRARELCDLRYQHDQKPAAIADAVGMTANSVAKALQRVRDQLRECIDHKAAMEGVAR